MKRNIVLVLLIFLSFNLHLHSGAELTGFKVDGKFIKNEKGETVQLRGVNKSGFEVDCIKGKGFGKGEKPEELIKKMKEWNINVVRLPLNEQCWLASEKVKREFGGEKYKNAIDDYVNLLIKEGFAIILSLNWTSKNGIADKQEAMPNKQNSILFWKSVAFKYGKNQSIIFDLFSDPFPNHNEDSEASWDCLKNGGEKCQGFDGAVGMQTLVDTVRGAESKNILMIPGVQFSNSLSKWEDYKPKDLLDPEQFAISWHSYNCSPCNNEECWNTNIEKLVDKYPLIAGEIGEDDCASEYIIKQMKWLDSKSSHYLAWTFNAGECKGELSLIDSKGYPTPFGEGFKNYLSKKPTTANTIQTEVAPPPEVKTDGSIDPNTTANTIQTEVAPPLEVKTDGSIDPNTTANTIQTESTSSTDRTVAAGSTDQTAGISNISIDNGTTNTGIANHATLTNEAKTFVDSIKTIETSIKPPINDDKVLQLKQDTYTADDPAKTNAPLKIDVFIPKNQATEHFLIFMFPRDKGIVSKVLILIDSQEIYLCSNSDKYTFQKATRNIQIPKDTKVTLRANIDNNNYSITFTWIPESNIITMIKDNDDGTMNSCSNEVTAIFSKDNSRVNFTISGIKTEDIKEVKLIDISQNAKNEKNETIKLNSNKGNFYIYSRQICRKSNFSLQITTKDWIYIKTISDFIGNKMTLNCNDANPANIVNHTIATNNAVTTNTANYSNPTNTSNIVITDIPINPTDFSNPSNTATASYSSTTDNISNTVNTLSTTQIANPTNSDITNPTNSDITKLAIQTNIVETEKPADVAIPANPENTNISNPENANISNPENVNTATISNPTSTETTENTTTISSPTSTAKTENIAITPQPTSIANTGILPPKSLTVDFQEKESGISFTIPEEFGVLYVIVSINDVEKMFFSGTGPYNFDDFSANALLNNSITLRAYAMGIIYKGTTKGDLIKPLQMEMEKDVNGKPQVSRSPLNDNANDCNSSSDEVVVLSSDNSNENHFEITLTTSGKISDVKLLFGKLKFDLSKKITENLDANEVTYEVDFKQYKIRKNYLVKLECMVENVKYSVSFSYLKGDIPNLSRVNLIKNNQSSCHPTGVKVKFDKEKNRLDFPMDKSPPTKVVFSDVILFPADEPYVFTAGNSISPENPVLTIIATIDDIEYKGVGNSPEIELTCGCRPPEILRNNKCVCLPPNVIFKNLCISCKDLNKNFYMNNCESKCPEYTLPVDNQCKTCEEKDSTTPIFYKKNDKIECIATPKEFTTEIKKNVYVDCIDAKQVNDEETKKCKICQAGYSPSGNNNCSKDTYPDCKEPYISDDTSKSCKTCEELGKYIRPSDKKCLTRCDFGQVYDTNGNCQTCDKFIINERCVENCPENTNPNKEKKSCDPCDGPCVKCPDNFIQEDGVCKKVCFGINKKFNIDEKCPEKCTVDCQLSQTDINDTVKSVGQDIDLAVKQGGGKISIQLKENAKKILVIMKSDIALDITIAVKLFGVAKTCNKDAIKQQNTEEKQRSLEFLFTIRNLGKKMKSKNNKNRILQELEWNDSLYEDINQNFYDTIDALVHDLIMSNDPNINNNNSTIIFNTDSLVVQLNSFNTTTMNIVPEQFGLSKIEFEQCKNALQISSGIPPSLSLYYTKSDLIEEDGIKIAYSIFNPLTGEKMDLSICQNLQIIIQIPYLQEDLDNELNFDSYYYYRNQTNANIYNDKDPFYSSRCVAYQNSTYNDVVLNDRRNQIYGKKNIFCMINDGYYCRFNEIDKDKNIICYCEVQNPFKYNNTILEISKFINSSIFNDVNSNNQDIGGCGNIVFSKDIGANTGFWISVTSLILFVGGILLTSQAHSSVGHVIPSNPPAAQNVEVKIEINKEISDIKIGQKSISDVSANQVVLDLKSDISHSAISDDRSHRKMYSDISQQKIYPDKVEVGRNSIPEVEKEQIFNIVKDRNYYEDLPILEHFNSDTRSNSQYFIDIILLKNHNLNLYFRKSIAEPLLIRFYYWSLFINLLFGFNAFFFSDSLIMDRKGENLNSFAFTWSNEFPKTLISLLTSVVFVNIIKTLFELSRSEKEELMEMTRSKVYKYEHTPFVIAFKFRIIALAFIIFVFHILTWYYITVFCGIYVLTSNAIIFGSIVSFITYNIIMATVIPALYLLIRLILQKKRNS